MTLLTGFSEKKNIVRALQAIAALVVAERIFNFFKRAYAKRERKLLTSKQPEAPIPVTFTSLEEDLNELSDSETTTTASPHRTFFPHEVSGVHLLTGNTAASVAAFAFSELAFIYPLTEEGYLGEAVAEWSARGGKNALNSSVKSVKFETRAGAASAVYGALTGGALTTTFAPSEALVSMVPSLYKIASDRLPTVFHVESRGVNDQDLSLFINQSDVVAASQAGISVLSSATPQEAYDIAIAAHLAALKTSSPFVHFFDGVQTAHEATGVKLIPYQHISLLLSKNEVHSHHERQNNSFVFPPQVSVIDLVEESLANVSALVGRSYKLFEYVGAPDATSVLVSLTAGSQVAEDTVKYLASVGQKVGLLKVRLLRPWSAKHFIAALPKTVSHIAILDQSYSPNASSYSQLFGDVASTLFSPHWKGAAPKIISGRVGGPNLKSFTPELIAAIFENLASKDSKGSFTLAAGQPTDLSPSSTLKFPKRQREVIQAIFWDSQAASHQKTTEFLFNTLDVAVQKISRADSYRQSPVFNTQLRLSSSATSQDLISFPAGEIRSADLIVVNDVSLLSQYNPLGNAKIGSSLLINAPWSQDQIESKLPATLKRDIFNQKANLYVINATKLAEDAGLSQQYSSLSLEAAFLKLVERIHRQSQEPSSKSLEKSLAALTKQVQKIHRDGKDPNIGRLAASLITETANSLKPLAIPKDWEIATPDESLLPSRVTGSLVVSQLSPLASPDLPSVSSANTLGKWHLAAWSLIFPEAYGTQQTLRAESSATYQVTVTENRRVTPDDYDRNVFHLEMDTTGTNLKYEIGDALGVHGHNHPDDVREFLAFYGLNPQDLLSTKRGEGLEETRTIEQLFTQQLDIFGRPTKKFYKALAPWATSSGERQKLEFLVSAEGSAEFKERVAETVTYADILQEFTSAHPPVEVLAEIIPAIKPRHYSIASSMKVHPNSVHLLVVLVDWTTPKGQKRFGQCTRYLVDLKAGAKITVSVKPSVMKLPPLDETPVVMAGLGTGMAPFRAFVEERAYAKAQGTKVGPMVLYFGSRHRSQEYLYGEELEAYNEDGLLTYLRLAFSRDQKEKVYIQNKMQEDAKILHQLLIEQKGHFYLCGPTWPAADVRDAISSAFQTIGGMSPKESLKTLNEMKEHERYVLEVY